jgi:hypothetical protein
MMKLIFVSCFNNWNKDLTCDTIYIQWLANFYKLYLDQMDSETNTNILPANPHWALFKFITALDRRLPNSYSF